ncbi:MAG: hypothetical protein GQ528_06320 [Woeseiaceae bacterium]|nr:hypothetical protein [Woeseiaceae bacterium]
MAFQVPELARQGQILGAKKTRLRRQKARFVLDVVPLDIVKKKFHKSVIFFVNVLKHLLQ